MSHRVQRMCDKCGQSIDPQRIEALPETRCCVGCSCERCRTVLDIETAGPDVDELTRAVTGVAYGE